MHSANTSVLLAVRLLGILRGLLRHSLQYPRNELRLEKLAHELLGRLELRPEFARRRGQIILGLAIKRGVRDGCFHKQEQMLLHLLGLDDLLLPFLD